MTRKCISNNCQNEGVGYFQYGGVASWHCQRCLDIFEAAAKDGIKAENVLPPYEILTASDTTSSLKSPSAGGTSSRGAGF
ncbi:MAG: hypothetical protein EKK48_12175 [Candidatus Melainabacteria bacterium]|nr:MAG: hypothetical protein EKK48_12175 [Candidatus Melainabacteria bacterium]